MLEILEKKSSNYSGVILKESVDLLQQIDASAHTLDFDLRYEYLYTTWYIRKRLDHLRILADSIETESLKREVLANLDRSDQHIGILIQLSDVHYILLEIRKLFFYDSLDDAPSPLRINLLTDSLKENIKKTVQIKKELEYLPEFQTVTTREILDDLMKVQKDHILYWKNNLHNGLKVCLVALTFACVTPVAAGLIVGKEQTLEFLLSDQGKFLLGSYGAAEALLLIGLFGYWLFNTYEIKFEGFSNDDAKNSESDEEIRSGIADQHVSNFQ